MRQSTYITANSGTECRKSTYRKSNLLCRLTMLVALLLTFALGAKAAQYTISNGNNYLGINIANYGNVTIGNVSPFDASTCVWTGPDNGSGTFSMTVNSTTYYLYYSSRNGLTVTTNQNYATNWTINGERLYTGTRYIRYNNGWTTANNPNNSTSGLDILAKVTYKDPTEITAEGVEILVGEEGQITYELTSTSGTPVYDNVTFSINNTSIATINATTGVVTGVSAGTATVTVTAKNQNGNTACTATCSVVVKEPVTLEYVFYYNGYYLAINDNGTDVERVSEFDPETCIWRGVETGTGVYSATVDGTTYYLQLPSDDDFAITTNINQATRWTRNGNKLSSTGDRYVRYNNDDWTTTGTSTRSGTDVLYPITKISEGTPTTTVEYTVGNTTVSPTAAAVDYGKSQQFTANASVTKTTTTTKTDTYEHSSSTVNTIQPKPSVSSTSSETLSPTGYDWSLSSTDNLTLGTGTASTNSVTYSTASGTAKNVTLNVTAYYMDGTSKKQGAAGTATITVNEKKDDPTGITAEDLTLAVDEQKSISYTLTPGNAYDNIAYSGFDNAIISITNGVVKGLKAGITTVTLTAKNLNGTNSAHSATSTVTVTPKAPTIEFALGVNNTATISTTETGATIYYTTDGTTPTISSSEYEAPVSVTAGATVKAIVVVKANGAQLTSPVAEALAMAESGVIGGTVFLYDLEDHTWTYYSGVDRTVDGGNYNDNYAGKLYSPNPRNVKITYNGVNGISGSTTNVRVSISENENSFVYYKTLEQGNTNGEYPYQVISNPFSVRPSVGSGNSKVYYGFNGWKIISGGEYIKGYNNGQILPLDAEIVFENLPYPNVNCISADIVFETSWAQANVQTGNDITTMMNNFTGGTYETNFAVLTGTYTTQWTGNKNATITSVYPDGSIDSRNNVSTRLNLTLNSGCTIKYEYIHINNNETTFSMGSGTKTLYLGRGISNTSANGVCCNLIQGYNNSISSGGLTYTIKIESGIYNYLSFIKGYNGGGTTSTVTGTVSVKGVLGCDYDRAKKNNSNLKIQNHAIMGYANTNVVLLKSPKAGDEVLNVTLKSGSLNSNTTSAGTADVSQSFYIGIAGGYSPGYRIFTMEGGEMWSLAAGICQNSAETNSIRFRIKGGLIKGSIYGSAANADSYGYKQMILTGGHVKGWIAGGGNGTSSNGGVTTGSTYIYVGGNCRVDSEGSNTKINSSLGGQVFGSGSGIDGTTNWGQMLYGTNVVVADNAYIERNVFGGGNFGWTEETANIYLTGDKMSVGGVYGGANQNKGDNVQVFMTGGTVRDGLYGGSNVEGVVGGNVTLQINGGQVGTSSAPANIHGGGYGQATRVSGNVEVTLGTEGQATDGVTVYGDVYGGSALGTVNSDANDHTYVTMYKGTINGSLYGGGLGSASVAANVNGPVKVEVRGGSVKATSAAGSGGVYGANNINGAPQRSVTVDIYGTDPAPAEGEYALYAVYGGGNQADYLYGNGYPTVTVHGCDNSIEYVYGGGNAAAVAATDVTIWGGDVIGNVFGGGNGTVTAANVTNGTNLKIYGGTILNVYGGSNSQGTIGGAINVKVESQAETGNSLCTMNIGSIYGGGNMAASDVGNIDIVCTGDNGRIDNVYGGANQANITGDIDLMINGGNIGNVFGGNNIKGDISGNITVTVGNDPNDCGVFQIDNVYGAGNLAPYGSESVTKGNYPVVNIYSGTIKKNVYGGGLGESAIVYGNPQVTIGDAVEGHIAIVDGDVYGGGDAADVEGTPVVRVVNDCNTQIGNVYGGGNAADVSATNVTINGGVITGMVFGGGHGDKTADPQTEANVTGDVNVLVTGGSINKVFGGSNSKGNITGTIALNIEKGDESCEMHIAEVYGGGNEAAGNAGTITIGCTGGEGEGIGDVYGGANAADINSGITLNITGGNISRVFGGNNASGNVSGDIVVNVDWTGTCGVNKLTNVYGAGNQAAYGNAENQGSTQVNILNATVSGSVYGGGLGNSAVVTGTTEVNIREKDGGTVVVSQNVFGGGDAAAVGGSTDVNIIAGAVAGSVFGGGNAAGVSGVGVVDVTGGTIASGVYGGSNASGTVGNTQVTLTNGTIGTDAAHANVHGGGFGQETGVSGNVDILIGESNQTEGGVEIYGDVYGGSALGTVNGTSPNDTYHTNVTLNKGTIYGSLYGGALGSNEVEANVYAPVTVTVNGGSVKKTAEEGSGGVYGANNINGAPQHSVIVNINATDPAPAEGQYALYAVYGGGNKAAYTYGNGYPKVTIYKCDNSIEYVYGGGNAAAVNGTNVTVWGGNTIGYVFGGGHGYKENSIGADVNGDVLVNIHGGTINKVFGGSNSMGNITGNISLNITKEGECEMHIAEVYGGGNEAAGNAGTITIGCTGGEGEGIGDVYGGANAADINSGITLNITGGNISRVFGGNNASGSISGGIAVNVNWNTENPCGVNYLGNVYGAGNLAPYSGKTAVNILNGTVTGSVFGGGLGDKAVVTGTTLVNINQESGGTVVVSQNVFGGGDAAEVTGSTDVNIIAGAVAGSVFGGGNAAGVSGDGVVDVTGGTIASGVYGGSNASGIVGNTQVTLTNGIIGTDAAHANVHGGGYGQNTVVSGNVDVTLGTLGQSSAGVTVYGDVYGGSALGTVNTNTNNTTAVNLMGGIIHGDAYGGGLGNSSTAADVNGNVTVTLDGTAFALITTKDDQNNTIPTSGRVFGCNNINGTPKGTVLVKVLQTVARDSEGNIIQKPEKGSGIYELEAVYGGGNLAAYNPTDRFADGPQYSYKYGNLDKNITAVDKPVQVIIDACDEASISYVYGGGNAAPTPATQVVVIGSYEIGNVFGGGNGKDRYTLDGEWQANNGADVGIIDATAYKNNPANGLYGTGRSRASVLGGTVHNVFGGSNTLGNIVTEAVAHLDEASDCPLFVDGIYGGGNEAYMDGDSKIELGCIEALEEIYGGARNADVKGDVNLKIVSGHYDRVFGGNNLGGVIKGSITITVEETGCNPVTIGELYACGNLAPYETPEGKVGPTINLISFTSIGNVFGGGLGSKAVVTGNPVVNINVNKVGQNANVEGWSYNGSTIDFGNEYRVELPMHEKGKIGVIGTVYGGGNEAKVVGNPSIKMTTGEVKRDIFGGGNNADIEGSTTVTITDGTIEGNVYGGGNEGNVTGATHVVIGPQPAQ